MKGTTRRRPLTTDQAMELGHTESETCSWRCQHCDGRVWFIGVLMDAPWATNCPYCGNETKNHARQQVNEEDSNG